MLRLMAGQCAAAVGAVLLMLQSHPGQSQQDADDALKLSIQNFSDDELRTAAECLGALQGSPQRLRQFLETALRRHDLHRLLTCKAWRALAAKTAPAATTGWDLLTPARFAKLSDRQKLDVLGMKSDPSLLQDEQRVLYWISLNDCAAAAYEPDDFAWDDIRNYYRGKEGKLLEALPQTITLRLPDKDQNLRNWSGATEKDFQLSVGRYDRLNKTFPLLDGHRSVNIRGLLFARSDRSVCHESEQFARPTVAVQLDKPFSPSGVAVDEAGARAFVDRAQTAGRSVTLQLVLSLLDGRVVVPEPAYETKMAVFRGRIEAARVLTGPSEVLGHLIRPSDPAALDASTPPSLSDKEAWRMRTMELHARCAERKLSSDACLRTLTAR